MPIQTATNPTTGERIAFINGQWVPYTQSATNDAGQKAFLVGSQWMYEPAPEPAPEPEKGFFSNIGNLLVEGGKQAIGAAKVAPSVTAGTVGQEQAATISEEAARKPKVMPKELQETMGAFKDESKQYEEAKGGWETAKAVGNFALEFGKQALTNPKGVAYMTAQSAANMAPSIAGMIVGGKAGALAGSPLGPGGAAIGATIGGIGGGFAGQAPMEIGAEFIDRVKDGLQERGLEPTEENVRALLSDKAFVDKAVGEARTKGLTTAAVDSLMTVGAGKFAAAPRRAAIKAAQQELGVTAKAADVAKRADEILKQGTMTQRAGRTIKRGTGAVGIDVAGGGLSEAAGQYAAYGKVDPESVALEMLGELGGSMIEVPGAAYATTRDLVRKKEEPAAAPQDQIKKAVQTAAQAPQAPQAPERSLEDLEREAGLTTAPEEPAAKVETLPPQAPKAPEPEAKTTEETAPAPKAPEQPAVPAPTLTPPAAEAPVTETPQQRLDRLSKMTIKMMNARRDNLITNQEYEKFHADLEAARAAAKGTEDTSQLSDAKKEILRLADLIEASGNKSFATGMRLNARPESKEPTAQTLEFYRSKLPEKKSEEPLAAQEEQTPYGLPQFFADSPKDADRIAALRGGRGVKVRVALDEVNDAIQKLADTIAAAGYDVNKVIAGQVPAGILRIKNQIGLLAADASRIAKSAEAIEKGYKKASPTALKRDIDAAMQGVTNAENLLSESGNLPPAAVEMVGTEKPVRPEVQELLDKQKSAVEDIGIVKGRSPNLFRALSGRLTKEEVRGLGGRNLKIGKNQFTRLIAKKQKAVDLSDLVDDGELDDFLPVKMRKGSGDYDQQESTEYIRERLVSGQYTTPETDEAVRKIEESVEDLERRIQEELTLEEINAEIQFAIDEQREADRASTQPPTEGETGVADQRQAEETTELDRLIAEAEEAGIDVSEIREDAYYDTRGEGDIYFERTFADRLRGAIAAQDQFLKQQTEEELRAKEEERKAAEKAEKEKARAEEEKAKADEAAADFVLTGSDRAADQAAARGQMELAPAEENVPRGEEVLSESNEAARQAYYEASKESEEVAKYKFSRLIEVANETGETINVWNVGGKLQSMAWNAEPPKYARLVATVNPEEKLKQAETGTGYNPDPEDQRIEKELSGLTMIQAADWAVKNAPNAFYKVIAEKVRNRLRDLERRGVKLEFSVATGDRRMLSLSSARGITKPDWGNDTKSTTISVTLNGAAVIKNQAGYPPGVNPTTLLHELLHVATRAQFLFMDANSPLGKQLVDLSNAIISQFNKDAKEGKLPPIMQAYYKRENNVLSLPDEILAWGLTNKDVQEYFSTIKVGDQSAMSKLVELVRQVLGLGKPYESALDRLVSVSESMLDEDVNTIEQLMGKRGYSLGKEKKLGDQQALFQQVVRSTIAGWSGDRIDSLIRTYGYNDGRTYGIAAFVDPRDFVLATTPTREAADLLSEESGDLDPEKIRKETQTPFINYDIEKGVIVGHEGRHRMAALARAGVQTAPVVLYVKDRYGSKKPDQYEELRSASMKGQSFSGGMGQRLTVTDLIPINYKNKDKLEQKFGSYGFLFEQVGATQQDEEPKSNVPRRNIYGDLIDKKTWEGIADSKLFGKYGTDDLIRALQDKYIDLKRVQTVIKDASREIGDKWDAYVKEELYHGRTSDRSKKFAINELDPVLEEMKKNRVSIGEIEQYLHNRHAEEYNKQVAKVNPNDPEMQDGGSGINTEDAREYLANIPEDKRKVYESIAAKIDSITKGTRELLVESGLEKAETIKAWEEAFPFYVPLQREDIDFQYTSNSTGTGRGFDQRGSFSRRAMGSKRNVVDILANIAMQRERAIVKSEKNRVSQAVYGLAIQNPNPDFWMAVNPAASRIPASAAEEMVALGIDPDDAQYLMQEPTQRAVDKKRNEVINRVNTVLRNNPNVLATRVNGEDRYVFFNNNDERAKNMVSALKNMDVDGLMAGLGLFAKATRYIAAVNTQYNPFFGAYNFLRDTQGAALQLSTTPIAGKQKEVIKGAMPALFAIYKDLRRERKKATPEQNEWVKLWQEFQSEGGQTGFRDTFSRSQDRSEAIQKQLSRINENNAMSKARAVFDWLSDYNDAMENAVRLSAYKVALDQGMTKQQAASVAKNLTVNFNRKGTASTTIGALYAFFNAAMQGTTRLVQTLRGPAGRKIIAGGLLLGAAQAIAMALAGYEEDEPPDFVKERNLLLPIPGTDNYIMLPMPLGYHVIPSTGRMLTEAAMAVMGLTKSRKGASERMTDLMGMYMSAFNPIGNAGWSAQTFAPTLLDPWAALDANKDWTGKRIYREDFSKLDPTPGFTRAKDAASLWSTKLAEFLNYASGGTEFRPGTLSPTPDQIDYLIGVATGGIGREITKLGASAKGAAEGEEVPLYKVPVVGRFVGETKGAQVEANRFYRNIEHLNKLENEIKGRAGKGGDVAEVFKENPEAALYKTANKIYEDIKKLKTKRDLLKERGVEKGPIQALNKAIEQKMKALNDAVDRLEK